MQQAKESDIRYGVRTTVDRDNYDGRASTCPDEAILSVLRQRAQGVCSELYAEKDGKIVLVKIPYVSDNFNLESIRVQVRKSALRQLTNLTV